MPRYEEKKEFEEKIIQINRVSKKTKGGNQIGFSVLMVVGDKKGRVGVGLGKAPDVLSGIKKASRRARKNLFKVAMKGTTIPHDIQVKFSAARILLKPAPPGSGIIAGGAVRAVLEVAGVQNILTKCLGSHNPHNLVKATIEGLRQLRAPAEIAASRGKSVREN